MSYALVIAETRRGVFEERNLDSLGLAMLFGKEVCMLMPDGVSPLNERTADSILRVRADEEVIANPLELVRIVEQITGTKDRRTVSFLHTRPQVVSRRHISPAISAFLLSQM